MSECTCAAAINESERRKAALPAGTRLFPRIMNTAYAVNGQKFIRSAPIFEEKVD